MYTTRQAAQIANIATSTVRLYAKEYSDYLSPSATPAPGEMRHFTADDIAVFRTVKAMRDMGATSEQIFDTLASGERYEAVESPETPPRGPQKAPEAPTGATMALELVKGQVEALQNERDYLREQLTAERAARIEAERQAARLAGQLEAQQAQDERPSLWRRLFG
jgi:DNA-binding transcriptional MerR regulator